MHIEFKTGVQNMHFDAVTWWLAETYWSPGITKEEVMYGAQNSSLVVGGFDEAGEQRSYMRVVSDKVRFAYVLDVIVHPEYRKRGIGKAMVAFAMQHPDLQLVYQWLLRTRDAQNVYTRLGFKTMENTCNWMMIRNERPDRRIFSLRENKNG
ncbi:MAG: GNAT family N-acetyltransferase [Nitrospirota bacterium]